MMHPFAPLSGFQSIFPGLLQSGPSEKDSKISLKIQTGKNVPDQTGPNAQVNSLKQIHAEMIDLKGPLQKVILRHQMETVGNSPRKAFLNYSEKNDRWIISGSLSFSKKLAIKLGLNDGGYSKAPFNPQSHNIASPGQRVRLEDMVERLEESQRQVLSQINFDEMLNSGAEANDDDELSPFTPDPPPEAASVLSPVAPQNPLPKAVAPPKPPRKPKPDACIQVIPTELPAVVPDRPDNGISLGNATDRAFDELFNSDPTLAQMSADAIEKEFDELFKNEQQPLVGRDRSPGEPETTTNYPPIRSPRKIDGLKKKESTQGTSLPFRAEVPQAKVNDLIKKFNNLGQPSST